MGADCCAESKMDSDTTEVQPNFGKQTQDEDDDKPKVV
jgi:hypothetical protein